MALFASQHKRGAEIAAPYLAHPRREVRRLADVLEGYWARAIEPVWPRYAQSSRPISPTARGA
jgi:hypothetical protein